MYAVIQTGGKQYRVAPGDLIRVEKLGGDSQDSIVLDQVLAIVNGEEIMVGQPNVAGASVKATIMGDELGKKIIVFKYKPKVRYRKKTGHRQSYTVLRIDEVVSA